MNQSLQQQICSTEIRREKGRIETDRKRREGREKREREEYRNRENEEGMFVYYFSVPKPIITSQYIYS